MIDGVTKHKSRSLFRKDNGKLKRLYDTPQELMRHIRLSFWLPTTKSRGFDIPPWGYHTLKETKKQKELRGYRANSSVIVGCEEHLRYLMVALHYLDEGHGFETVANWLNARLPNSYISKEGLKIIVTQRRPFDVCRRPLAARRKAYNEYIFGYERIDNLYGKEYNSQESESQKSLEIAEDSRKRQSHRDHLKEIATDDYRLQGLKVRAQREREAEEERLRRHALDMEAKLGSAGTLPSLD